PHLAIVAAFEMRDRARAELEADPVAVRRVDRVRLETERHAGLLALLRVLRAECLAAGRRIRERRRVLRRERHLPPQLDVWLGPAEAAIERRPQAQLVHAVANRVVSIVRVRIEARDAADRDARIGTDLPR